MPDYSRAFVSIFDANSQPLLVALILLQGSVSGEGFAITSWAYFTSMFSGLDGQPQYLSMWFMVAAGSKTFDGGKQAKCIDAQGKTV